MISLGNLKTHRILLQLDDRTLEDAGISRDLLEQGVSAWPWRIEEASDVPCALVEPAAIQQRSVTATLPDDDFKHAA